MEDSKKKYLTVLNMCLIFSGPAGKWRLSVETLSSRECATCPSICSFSGPSTACCTINSSWRGSASTTHPPTMTSGTAEVLLVSTPTSLPSSSSFFALFNPPRCAISASLADISEMVLQLQGTMMKMENFQKLLELKKDLTGIDNLTIPGRVRRFALNEFVSFYFLATFQHY